MGLNLLEAQANLLHLSSRQPLIAGTSEKRRRRPSATLTKIQGYPVLMFCRTAPTAIHSPIPVVEAAKRVTAHFLRHTIPMPRAPKKAAPASNGGHHLGWLYIIHARRFKIDRLNKSTANPKEKMASTRIPSRRVVSLVGLRRPDSYPA